MRHRDHDREVYRAVVGSCLNPSAEAASIFPLDVLTSAEPAIPSSEILPFKVSAELESYSLVQCVDFGRDR